MESKMVPLMVVQMGSLKARLMANLKAFPKAGWTVHWMAFLMDFAS